MGWGNVSFYSGGGLVLALDSGCVEIVFGIEIP